MGAPVPPFLGVVGDRDGWPSWAGGGKAAGSCQRSPLGWVPEKWQAIPNERRKAQRAAPPAPRPPVSSAWSGGCRGHPILRGPRLARSPPAAPASLPVFGGGACLPQWRWEELRGGAEGRRACGMFFSGR